MAKEDNFPIVCKSGAYHLCRTYWQVFYLEDCITSTLNKMVLEWVEKLHQKSKEKRKQKLLTLSSIVRIVTELTDSSDVTIFLKAE